MTALQEKLVSYIGVIADDKLANIEPLIKMMAKEFAYELEEVDFNDLTDEEKQAVIEGREDYQRGNFIPLDKI